MLRVKSRLINNRINRNIMRNAKIVLATSNKPGHDPVTDESSQIGSSLLVENSAAFFDSKNSARTRGDTSQEVNQVSSLGQGPSSN